MRYSVSNGTRWFGESESLIFVALDPGLTSRRQDEMILHHTLEVCMSFLDFDNTMEARYLSLRNL